MIHRRNGRKGTHLFRRMKRKFKSLTDLEFQSAVSFRSYYRRLKVRPRVNVALFPNIRLLELDGQRCIETYTSSMVQFMLPPTTFKILALLRANRKDSTRGVTVSTTAEDIDHYSSVMNLFNI